MLKIKECVEILNKCTPNFFQYNEWLVDRGCPTVLCMYLDGIMTVIDKSEIGGKTDDEIKKLINSKIIDRLKDVITEIDPNYFGVKHDPNPTQTATENTR